MRSVFYNRFLITKVGSAVVCSLFVLMIDRLKVLSETYTAAAAYDQEPKEVTVLCNFNVSL